MTNYLLNKFMPFLIIGALLFLNFGFYKFEPYIILALACYINCFNYKVGYSVGICESKGISLK